ncbi:retron St85 family RNA-directed DNA polymerase [Rahnella inusitata]|jgi:RNA-directed DNA polymerase|uniref:retron St85 family RNA-directed DNA polymerase n=1 Tax=Rahnella inusitata TaxID=58169 RepID=UPI0039BE2010
MEIKKELSDKLGISTIEIDDFCINAPKKYKVYSIPKRKLGKRVIAQPTKQLKIFQRVLVDILRPVLPIHDCATAYRQGISIKDNAEKHKNNSFILKMDFQNFFNKIKFEFFFLKFKKIAMELSYSDIYTLRSLLFWKPGTKRSTTLVLSVGAPSSPIISNFVMFDFDKHLHDYCENINVVYTRYADDLTFSTNTKGLLFSMPSIVKSFILEHAPGQTINDAKTVFSSKAHNRHVTGVTISNDGKLSLGRERKRYISSLVHKHTLGILSADDFSYLRGLLSYAYHIEPIFLVRLGHKYGTELITKIVRGD